MRGRCRAHERERSRQYNEARGSSTQQGYGATWRELRKLVLHEEPICRQCRNEQPGPLRLSAEIDHIVPLKQGGTNERANLQGLCKHHHSLKTAQQGRWGSAS